MKRAILMSVLAIATTMASVNAFADADAQYRAGADFARQVQGQGESSLKNFNPSASIPNYTASPGEKKYYGGVTATGDGALKADGTTGWTTNEATKAVTDSFVNNPKEPISPDAPLLRPARMSSPALIPSSAKRGRRSAKRRISAAVSSPTIPVSATCWLSRPVRARPALPATMKIHLKQNRLLSSLRIFRLLPPKRDTQEHGLRR